MLPKGQEYSFLKTSKVAHNANEAHNTSLAKPYLSFFKKY